MRRRSVLAGLALVAVAAAAAATAAERTGPGSEPAWPWGEELDAVAAAPQSHRVLLENDRVRVLEVVIRPGEREPPHTHRWPSVMTVIERARLRYYGADGGLRFETPPRSAEPPAELGADWLGPEGLHAVENIDERPFRALRVELKGPADGAGRPGSAGEPAAQPVEQNGGPWRAPGVAAIDPSLAVEP